MKPAKICPEGSFLNPVTNRCNKIKEKKSAQKSPKKEIEESPPGKIWNPKSKRYVNIDGKIGKELMKNKAVSPKAVSPKANSPKPKEIDNMHLVLELVKTDKNNLHPFDRLKANMLKLNKITFSTEKDHPSFFILKFNDKPNGARFITDDIIGETIYGRYNKKYRFLLHNDDIPVYPRRTERINLLLQDGNNYIRIQDIKQALKSENYACDVFKASEGTSSHLVETAIEFLKYVFNSSPTTLTPRVHTIIVPPTYTEDKSVNKYEYAKPVPTIAIDEQTTVDLVFVSLKESIVYVFHLIRPEFPTMKGYIPIGVTVVRREMKKVNYSYKYIMRLALPSWGLVNNDADISKLSEYMQEIRNIIISIPYLAKFRALSPYPRLILGCKVSKDRLYTHVCNE